MPIKKDGCPHIFIYTFTTLKEDVVTESGVSCVACNKVLYRKDYQMPIENEMTKEEFDKEQKRLKRERWEIMFAHQLEAEGFTFTKADQIGPGEYKREYIWHPIRKWRTDFLISKSMSKDLTRTYIPFLILVELEGAVGWGRHTRKAGFIEDCIKYNTALSMGWHLYRFATDQVKDGSAIKFLREEVWKL